MILEPMKCCQQLVVDLDTTAGRVLTAGYNSTEFECTVCNLSLKMLLMAADCRNNT